MCNITPGIIMHMQSLCKNRSGWSKCWLKGFSMDALSGYWPQNIYSQKSVCTKPTTNVLLSKNFPSSCHGNIMQLTGNSNNNSEKVKDWCASRKEIKVWVYCKFMIICPTFCTLLWLQCGEEAFTQIINRGPWQACTMSNNNLSSGLQTRLVASCVTKH